MISYRIESKPTPRWWQPTSGRNAFVVLHSRTSKVSESSELSLLWCCVGSALNGLIFCRRASLISISLPGPIDALEGWLTISSSEKFRTFSCARFTTATKDLPFFSCLLCLHATPFLLLLLYTSQQTDRPALTGSFEIVIGDRHHVKGPFGPSAELFRMGLPIVCGQFRTRSG